MSSLAGTTQYDVYNASLCRAVMFNLSACLGSTLTRAQALVAGWTDLGHVINGGITPSVTKTPHSTSRLGVKSTDMEVVTDSSLTVAITAEEWGKFTAGLMLCGTPGSSATQAAFPSGAADSFAFTKAAPSGGANVWYNIRKSNADIRLLSAAAYSVPAESVTFDAGTDVFTTSGHLGWKNGTRVLMGGTPPTGFTAIDYFIINYTVGATNDTFQLATAVGGTAVTGSDAGTSVTVTQQFDEGEQVITDARLGRVRFLYPVSQTVTVTVTAPAIDANNNPEYMWDTVTPMDDLTKVGWFRLVGYADAASTQVVSDWIFQGTITAKGASSDGSKATSMDFEILVGADKGTFNIAP